MITRPAKPTPNQVIDIDLSDPWGAITWCNKLRCTYEELRSAVQRVGSSWYLVNRYFANKTPAGLSGI